MKTIKQQLEENGRLDVPDYVLERSLRLVPEITLFSRLMELVDSGVVQAQEKKIDLNAGSGQGSAVEAIAIGFYMGDQEVKSQRNITGSFKGIEGGEIICAEPSDVAFVGDRVLTYAKAAI